MLFCSKSDFRFYTDEDYDGPDCELQAIQEGEEKDFCGSDILGDSSTSSESDYPDDEEEEDPEALDMYKWLVFWNLRADLPSV